MDIRVLKSADAAVLENVADGVFDGPVVPALAAEFLADPRHSICVAVVDGLVVGMATGVRYVHPDKPSEFWINEVGVSPSFQRRGVAKAIMTGLLDHARAVGCREAWVLTEHDNRAARALYGSVGGRESEAGVMVTYRLDRSAG